MILTIGTSLALARTMMFDRLTPDSVNRAAEVRVSAAGKSVNVARVVHTLGEAALAVGIVGGNTGADLAAELRAAGIPHDLIAGSAPTRVCVTIVDRAAGTATELVEEPSPVSAGESDQLWEKLLELVPRATVIVMSGTLAPGVPHGFYAMICRLARDAGVPAIVDAGGPELLACLPQQPLLVKPNRAELQATLGRPIVTPTETLDAIAQLLARGARQVAVTAGKDAVWFAWNDATRRLTPPGVHVVSPIGSGDAFAAGFAVAVARGMPPLECARLGVACGSANAMTPQAGFIDPATVEQCRRAVVVA